MDEIGHMENRIDVCWNAYALAHGLQLLGFHQRHVHCTEISLTRSPATSQKRATSPPLPLQTRPPNLGRSGLAGSILGRPADSFDTRFLMVSLLNLFPDPSEELLLERHLDFRANRAGHVFIIQLDAEHYAARKILTHSNDVVHRSSVDLRHLNLSWSKRPNLSLRNTTPGNIASGQTPLRLPMTGGRSGHLRRPGLHLLDDPRRNRRLSL